jgi:hypothetical protein
VGKVRTPGNIQRIERRIGDLMEIRNLSGSPEGATEGERISLGEVYAPESSKGRTSF